MTLSNAYPKHTTNTKTIVFTQLYPPFVFLFSTQKPARHLFRYRHGWRGWRSNRPLRQPLSFPAFSNTVISLQQGRWIKNLLMILMGIQPTRWKVNPPKHSAIIHRQRDRWRCLVVEKLGRLWGWINTHDVDLRTHRLWSMNWAESFMFSTLVLSPIVLLLVIFWTSRHPQVSQDILAIGN